MLVTLSDKSAVVTGAASGIGLAVVAAYLEADAAGVVAVDRQRSDALDALAAAQPDRLVAVHGDVTSDETHERAVGAALDRWGRLDIFVHNAAVSVVKPLHEHTETEWDAVLDTNVKALWLASRKVVPAMTRAGGGVILVTGSISGQAGIPGQGAYAASKGALHQMTRQMAIEYAGVGIRVNAICLGTVDTPLVRWSAEASGDPDSFWAMLREGHPIGRIARPEEVAAFYVYLASDRATFFTGATLFLDGGYTAR